MPTIRDGIAAIRGRWPDLRVESDEDPIFILSAGWRSGSTLLQRLVSHACLVWGEPYGHSGMIERLAEPIRAFTETWPEPHFFYRGETPDVLVRRFIANLYPPPMDLIAAHQLFLLRLFAEPARRAGAPRWGLKEVRLGIDHAAYLRWLFPCSKILLLIRNPYDAYRSYAVRRDAGWQWYRRWPDEPVTTAVFARNWRTLVPEFLDGHAEVDGLIVRYEDVARGRHAEIEQYLGFGLSAEAARSNPSDDGPRRPPACPPRTLTNSTANSAISPARSAILTADGRPAAEWPAQGAGAGGKNEVTIASTATRPSAARSSRPEVSPRE